MMHALLKKSALMLPPIRRMKNELDALRRSQALYVQATDRLAFERQTLQGEIETLRSKIDRVEQGRAAVPEKNFSNRDWAACFSEELIDLGTIDPKYAGVFTPKSEIGLPKLGITDCLLGGAEEYFQKNEHFGYNLWMLKPQFSLLGVIPQGLAIDIGSGFGNTVIPLLETYPDLSIIATDLSPDLLAILRREADKRGIGARCVTVAMDSQRDYFTPEFADHAFGCAVLHHLVEPAKAVSAVLSALKPGGHAIFLEPFEAGSAILRLAYLEIFNKAEEVGLQNEAIEFLKGINTDIIIRIHHGRFRDWPGQWENLDDKWLFTRNFFNRLRVRLGASEIEVRPIYSTSCMFTEHTRGMLESYAGLKVPDALPDWAWDILKRYDQENFSDDMKQELIIEGAVVITK